MGNGEREGENRKLAEWLGFRFESDSTNADFHQWHHPDCKCTSKSGPDKCLCVEGCYWGNGAGDEPPDFRTDEAANAMLLEKMASLYGDKAGSWFALTLAPNGLGLGPDSKIRKGWMCGAYTGSGEYEDYAEEIIFQAVGTDRKEVVCLAALALLNERGQG